LPLPNQSKNYRPHFLTSGEKLSVAGVHRVVRRTFGNRMKLANVSLWHKADIPTRSIRGTATSLRNQDMCGSLSPFRPLQNPAVIAAQIIVPKEARHAPHALHRRVHRIRPSSSRHQHRADGSQQEGGGIHTGTVRYTGAPLHDTVGGRQAVIINHKARWQIK
jgi:hypothetical protein